MPHSGTLPEPHYIPRQRSLVLSALVKQYMMPTVMVGLAVAVTVVLAAAAVAAVTEVLMAVAAAHYMIPLAALLLSRMLRRPLKEAQRYKEH